MSRRCRARCGLIPGRARGDAPGAETPRPRRARRSPLAAGPWSTRCRTGSITGSTARSFQPAPAATPARRIPADRSGPSRPIARPVTTAPSRRRWTGHRRRRLGRAISDSPIGTTLDALAHAGGADSTLRCSACHDSQGADPMRVSSAVVENCLECHGIRTAHLSAPDTACVTCHVPLVQAVRLTEETGRGFSGPRLASRAGLRVHRPWEARTGRRRSRCRLLRHVPRPGLLHRMPRERPRGAGHPGAGSRPALARDRGEARGAGGPC